MQAKQTSREDVTRYSAAAVNNRRAMERHYGGGYQESSKHRSTRIKRINSVYRLVLVHKSAVYAAAVNVRVGVVKVGIQRFTVLSARV